MKIETVMPYGKIDPDPFTIAFTIVGSTTAVVGMLDVIRRAIRQERMDREETDTDSEETQGQLGKA